MTLPKISLIGLKADQFRHPLDLAATRSLKQLPGMDLLVRNFLGPIAEEFFYLNNISASVLVGKKQLPHLHQLLIEACATLDLEVPQMYVQQHPQPNAYTFAMRGKQPFLVLHTSLIDLLTPAEIQAVIAHELGHLKCEHGVYITLANIFVLAAGLLPDWGTAIAQQLREQMLEWIRCAEFSCDRAALLATQNPKTVASVLMKLAGGSPTLAPLLNVEAFLDQARAYDRASSSDLGQMLRTMQTASLSHPVPVLRAREIDRWATSQDYQNLLKRQPMSYNGQESIKGEWRNW
ncbi:MAG: M48 family metallopeptidase [Coleofasciculaceae cyanobacterium SM2_1_6]|nr:M48 family metallopeptidase [Coleofasciculaceae cyanobacterium SM2_1_6]